MNHGAAVARTPATGRNGRHRATALGVVLLIVVAAAPSPSGHEGDPQVAKPTQVGTGAISGTVVDASDGSPLQGAVVYLGVRSVGPGAPTPRVVTDAKGRFVFRNLVPSDAYGLWAGRIGYFDGWFGAQALDDFGKVISLKEGQWFSSAVIKLLKPAAVTGRILDESGEPVVNAFVQALPTVMIAGTVRAAQGSVARTDDLGRYRLRGLARGSYLIAVPSPQHNATGVFSQNRLTYPTVLFPGVTSASLATPVQVDFGEERRGIDVTWTPVPAVTVSGQLDGSEDARSGVTVKLIAIGNENLVLGMEAATTQPDRLGRFTLSNVPPGQYRLQAKQSFGGFSLNPAAYERAREVLPGAPGEIQTNYSFGVTAGPIGMTLVMSGRQAAETHWADMAVSVGNADVSGLVVAMRPTLRLSGRIVVESTSGKAPIASPIAVTLEPANGAPSLGMPSGQVNLETSEFSVAGLRSGKYVVRLSLPNGWTVKSIKCAIRDCPDGNIDATSGLDPGSVVIGLTDQINMVIGRVLDSQGKVIDDCIVWAFPSQPNLWAEYGLTPPRIRQTRVSGEGGYSIRGLPAGEYYLVALPSTHLQEWIDPAVLTQAGRVGTVMRIGWGESQTRDLTLREIK